MGRSRIRDVGVHPFQCETFNGVCVGGDGGDLRGNAHGTVRRYKKGSLQVWYRPGGPLGCSLSLEGGVCGGASGMSHLC